METKILKAVFGGGTSTVTNKRTRTDYGQVLEIIGIDLPDTFECIFSNSATSAGTGKKMIGSNQRCLIPDEYLATGQTIYAWILLHDTEDDGRHMYSVRIPVADMPDTSPEEPTPVEQSVISQAITALNSAVTTTTQKALEATESADRAEQAAEGAEGYAERAEAAQSASESARDRATQAETSARTSAATATEKASEAISSATTASQSALTAENASESAQEYATASAESASQASQSADTASSKASDAQGYASSADTSAQTAFQKASEAAQSASTAVQAKTDAETAKRASETAQGLAESARDGAVTAKADAKSARDEAQSIANGITGKVEQIDSNTDRIESLEDDRYKPYPTDSASGAVASFPDGADNIPLKSCIVQIDPVQDLHGYDNPWPAGGGKNKLDKDALISNGYINVSGNITSTSGWTSSPYIEVSANTTYTLSNAQKGGSGTYIACYDANQGFISSVPMVANTNTTFTTPNDCKYVRVSVRTFDNEQNTAQLEQGSSATSYAPYSNICPISGWTGCEVQRTGVNVWDEEWEIGNFNFDTGLPTSSSSRLRSKNYIPCKGDTVYYGAFDGVYLSGSWYGVLFYGADKSYLGYTPPNKNNSFTTHSDAHYMKFVTSDAWYGVEYTGGISINYPSTDYDYHPYVGQTYPITFPSEAGTVYGGTLDVTNGVLTVDRAYAELTKDSNWEWNNNNSIAICSIPRAVIVNENNQREILVQNNLFTNSAWAGRTAPEYSCGLYFGASYVFVRSANHIASVDDLKAVIGDRTLQVVYPLATPITYQLNPQEIKTLLGENNVWANTGDVSVEYRADVTLYISRLTEPDADMIADANITSGSYFMAGNDLYRATINIASGASVIVGTNATKVSLAQALNEINA